MEQNYINHIALVLDASGSMQQRKDQVIRVADNQIAYLAQRSRELDQETRITVYSFDTEVRCLIYDKDVLRLPSLKGLYSIGGMTALIDAAIKSQEDLAATAQLYGDHAFLTYVLTDGMENASRKRPQVLKALLDRQPDNWTLAVFVPDQNGVFEAKRFGFPSGNIAVWDTTAFKGFEEAGDTIRQTTDNFMQARSTGTFRGTKNIFDMSPANLNRANVVAALEELKKTDYDFLNVLPEHPKDIAGFIRHFGMAYKLGMAYYQLRKSEEIQPQKKICVLDKKNLKVYSGAHARDLLGLPPIPVKVRPADNPQYDVFVQSTSVNRKLVPGTRVLVTTK